MKCVPMSALATTGLSRPRGLHVLVTSGVAALAQASGASGGRIRRIWSIVLALLNWDAGVNIDRLRALYDAADVRPR